MTGAHCSFVTARDGAQILVKDWGRGTPVVFSHGWPLDADIWDDQLLSVGGGGIEGAARRPRAGADCPLVGTRHAHAATGP